MDIFFPVLLRIFPNLPPEVHVELEREVKELIKRDRSRLLGRVQLMLSDFQARNGKDMSMMRRALDEIFLEEDP